jgi:rubredoxin
MKKNIPEVLKKIDWTDLRTQKTLLLETINNDAVDPEHKEALEGILALLDSIQDYAVDEMGVPEMLVFDFEKEEDREIKPKTKTKIKTLWLCPHCGSDNVEMKVWVNVNTNELGVDCEEDEGYCNDCEEHGELILSTLKASAKLEGYQVVDDEKGDIHPDMVGSFCLYSLSQAKEMLKIKATNLYGSGNWKLLAIWTGDVEEPTMMFKGDLRK